jgi:hypothetical protein
LSLRSRANEIPYYCASTRFDRFRSPNKETIDLVAGALDGRPQPFVAVWVVGLVLMRIVLVVWGFLAPRDRPTA